MPNKIQFIQEQIDDIIYRYKVFYSIRQISFIYNCSHGVIKKILNDNNIVNQQHKYMKQLDKRVCKTCNNVKRLEFFTKNKYSINGYSAICLECNKERNKQWVNNNKDKKKLIDKIYKMNNKYKRNSRESYRNKHDTKYRITKCLRNRIRKALLGISKSKPTMKLLGCDIEHLKIYLQYTAYANDYLDFDINNYSGQEYHIDHVKPCSSFNLEDPEEQIKCFHYTNLQILSVEDNLSKSNKLLQISNV